MTHAAGSYRVTWHMLQVVIVTCHILQVVIVTCHILKVIVELH